MVTLLMLKHLLPLHDLQNLSSWPKSFVIAVQVCVIPKSKYATFQMYTIVLCLTCSMTELLIFMNLFGINDAV